MPIALRQFSRGGTPAAPPRTSDSTRLHADVSCLPSQSAKCDDSTARASTSSASSFPQPARPPHLRVQRDIAPTRAVAAPARSLPLASWQVAPAAVSTDPMAFSAAYRRAVAGDRVHGQHEAPPRRRSPGGQQQQQHTPGQTETGCSASTAATPAPPPRPTPPSRCRRGPAARSCRRRARACGSCAG
jgi:hypothetical protein